jgi:hypothetical protein
MRPQRIPSDFYSSSPVLADGKIYVTGETSGVTVVFQAGPKFRQRQTPSVTRAHHASRHWPSRRASSSSRQTRTCGWWDKERSNQ